MAEFDHVANDFYQSHLLHDFIINIMDTSGSGELSD